MLFAQGDLDKDTKVSLLRRVHKHIQRNVATGHAEGIWWARVPIIKFRGAAQHHSGQWERSACHCMCRSSCACSCQS